MSVRKKLITGNMAASPWFPDMRVGRGTGHVLWSPIDPDECSSRIHDAAVRRTGLLSTRLVGSVEGHSFKIRHASAIDLGLMMSWAQGVVEESKEGSLIRFRFGPFRSLRRVFIFNSILFALVSIGLIVALIAQIANPPETGVSGDLKAWAIIFPFFTLYFLAMERLSRSWSNPDSLIRLLCKLLDAQVVDQAAKRGKSEGTVKA
jgi:hypothetical protein